MPIYVNLLPKPSSTGGLPTITGIVTATIPELDNCPILTRLKAFIVDQGSAVTLEHVFRDKTGNPVDLSAWLSTPSSQSMSQTPAGTVKIIVKEWLAEGAQPIINPIFEAWGEGISPSNGVVRAALTEDMVETAGIYEINWAVLNELGRPVIIDRGIISVERSLFPVSIDVLYKNLGPATLQEIRMMMMDSSPNENLLLDDIEFNDEQILLALAKPIRQWNETPPPIMQFTTRNFPYKGAWTSAVLGELHMMAAHKYRRNRLQHSAGGVTIDDLNKEREYMAEGQRLLQEYTSWLLNKKISLNMKLFVGQAPSQYSHRSGWALLFSMLSLFSPALSMFV